MFFVIKLFTLFPLTWGAGSVMTSSFDVIPSRGAGLENVVIDSQITALAGTTYTRINMHLGCFATNLRSVNNPVNEFSMVTALIDVYDSSNTPVNYQIQFPAEFLKSPGQRTYGQADMDRLIKVITPSTGVSLKAFDNTIQLLIPHIKTLTLSSTGEVSNTAEKNLALSGLRFVQGPIPLGDLPGLQATFAAAGSAFPAKYETGSYTGFAGPLSARTTWYISNDTSSIDITADFPGAARPGQTWGVNYQGFCGGFYSPLVLFFDEEMPEFSGRSAFPLFENQTNKIHWPESGSKAYFLILDKNKNRKVDGGDELFGDRNGFKNGFENLSSYDFNKDGVIDRKDAVYSQLLLWNDLNGDGISSSDELFTLSKMELESIDLKYTLETKKFGSRAEYRERSAFKFKKSGKSNIGKIVDIWLSAAGIK